MNEKTDQTILVIDDDALVRESTARQLEAMGFYTMTASGAREALNLLQSIRVAVVISDIRMPEMSGLDFLQEVRRTKPELPVILFTAYTELEAAAEAVRLGASDFIIKPFKPEFLQAAVSRALEHRKLIELEQNYKTILEQKVKERTKDLELVLDLVKKADQEMIQQLVMVSEYRDDDTGSHIKRIGRYSLLLAEALGMDANFRETLVITSSMHDIGKVGIPDEILLKKRKLTPEEFEIIKTHTRLGHQMLESSKNSLFKMAQIIALGHHEKWDGSGYPEGLKGETIPLECRIVMLCDQYDALRSKRPYKPAFGHVKTCKILKYGDERTIPGHFDPKVLAAFSQVAKQFDHVFAASQAQDIPGKDDETHPIAPSL